MRRYFNWAVISSAVALLLTTWLAPKTITWWFQPPVPTPVSCNEAVLWGTNKLVEAQFTSVLIGLVAGAVLAFAFRKKGPPAAAAALPASGPAAAPAAPAPAADPAVKK